MSYKTIVSQGLVLENVIIENDAKIRDASKQGYVPFGSNSVTNVGGKFIVTQVMTKPLEEKMVLHG